MAAIVYVDDELMLCRVFERILQRHSVEVLTFTEPREALAYIRTHPVLVIVCDYRMPSLSGLELLAQIEDDIPFILVSGDLEIAAQVRGNPRVTRVLSKPFRPETLNAVIADALAARPAG